MRSLKGYRWRYLFTEIRPSEELINKYGRFLAQLLANRGWEAPPAEVFLSVSPLLLPHHEEAFERILSAVRKGKPIVVFGDYDVDGLTSTALMVKILKRLGAKKVYAKIPERSEGYGLVPPTVEKITRLSSDGGLIIALDNGTKEVEAVTLALERGWDVVIFDHHEPGEKLPSAPVVNPKIPQNSPRFLKDLSTVGLVYLFALFLEKRGFIENAEIFADLAALGTVADVSPLSELNAKLVKKGLRLLNSGETSSVGLKLLLESLNRKVLEERDIAFSIAPRLNAFGRMERAQRGLKFLTTERAEEAAKLLKEMEALNEHRRKLTKEALKRVLKHYEKNPSKALIYIADIKTIPKGVLGIVAGRATSILGVPSVIFAADGETAVGSIRSPQGLNIVKVLERLSPLMERWGGHAQAAGLSVRVDRLATFRTAFEREIENYELEPPTLEIDFPLKPTTLRSKPRLVEDMQRLSPFGAGNPHPRFVFDDVLVDFNRTPYGYRLLFEENGKLFLNLEDEGEFIPSHYRGRKVRVVYTVESLRNLKLLAEDIKPL